MTVCLSYWVQWTASKKRKIQFNCTSLTSKCHTRGNHGNLTTGQPCHLSHCPHSGKTCSYHLVPSEEGGAKSANVPRQSMSANDNNYRCAMTITASQQSFPHNQWDVLAQIVWDFIGDITKELGKMKIQSVLRTGLDTGKSAYVDFKLKAPTNWP